MSWFSRTSTRELVFALAAEIREMKRRMTNLKDDLTAVNDKLDTVTTSFGTLKADITQTLADFQANNPNDPAVLKLVAEINSKVDAFASSITDEDATVKAADPGQPA